MGLGQIFFAEALHTFFVDVASYDSLKFHIFLVTKKWCHILIDEIRPTTRCDRPTLRCPSTFLQRVRSYRIMARCWLPKARCCGKKFGTRNWESNNESDMILINRVISCCNVFSLFCTTVKDSFIFVGPFFAIFEIRHVSCKWRKIAALLRLVHFKFTRGFQPERFPIKFWEFQWVRCCNSLWNHPFLQDFFRSNTFGVFRSWKVGLRMAYV